MSPRLAPVCRVDYSRPCLDRGECDAIFFVYRFATEKGERGKLRVVSGIFVCVLLLLNAFVVKR